MSIKLRDEYDEPCEKALADMAYVGALNSETYETPGEYLFYMLVRGVRIYVEAWAESDDYQSLGALAVDHEDIEDPSRVLDPVTNRAQTLLVLTLDAIRDNIDFKLEGDS